jgi:hypothetical protein
MDDETEPPKILPVIVQIARPSGPDDPGRVETAHYVVVRGTVMLCDSDGHALHRNGGVFSARSIASPTRWERKLKNGEDPLRVARDLLWSKWKSQRGSDFHRPLRPPPKLYW